MTRVERTRSRVAACRCLNVRVRYLSPTSTSGGSKSSSSSPSPSAQGQEARTTRVQLDDSSSPSSTSVSVSLPLLVGRELVSLGGPFTVPALRCLHCGTTVYAVEKAASLGPSRAVGFQANANANGAKQQQQQQREASPSPAQRSASRDGLIKPHDGHVFLLPGLVYDDEIQEVEGKENFSSIYGVSITSGSPRSLDQAQPSTQSQSQSQRPALTTQRSATSHYGLQGLPAHLVTTPPTSPSPSSSSANIQLPSVASSNPLASALDATGLAKLRAWRVTAEQEVMDLVRQKRRELDGMLARAQREAEAVLEQARTVPPPSTTMMLRGAEGSSNELRDEHDHDLEHEHGNVTTSSAAAAANAPSILPASAFTRRPPSSPNANLSASLSALSASFAMRGKGSDSTMSQAEDWAQRRRLKERYPEGDHSVMTSAATSAATSVENSDSETVRRARTSVAEEEEEEAGEDRGRGRQRVARVRTPSGDEQVPARSSANASANANANTGTPRSPPGTKTRPTMAPSSLSHSAGSKSLPSHPSLDLGAQSGEGDAATPRPGGRVGKAPPSPSANVQLRPRNPPPSGAEPLKPATRQRLGESASASASSSTPDVPGAKRKVAFAETPDHAPTVSLTPPEDQMNGVDGEGEDGAGREPVNEGEAAVFDIDEELSVDGHVDAGEGEERREALQGGQEKLVSQEEDLGGTLDDADADDDDSSAVGTKGEEKRDPLGGVPASVGAHHAGSLSALVAASEGLDAHARRASLVDNFDPASLRRDGRIAPAKKGSPPANATRGTEPSRADGGGEDSPRRTAIGYRRSHAQGNADAELRLSGLLAPHAPSHRSLWRRTAKKYSIAEEDEEEGEDGKKGEQEDEGDDRQWSAWQERARQLEEAKVKRDKEEKERVLAQSLPMQERRTVGSTARGIPTGAVLSSVGRERETSGFDREPKTSLPYQERQMVPSLRRATRRALLATGTGDRKASLPTIKDTDVEGDDVPRIATRGFAVTAPGSGSVLTPPATSALSSPSLSTGGRRSPRPPYVPPPPPTSTTTVLQPNPLHRPSPLTLFRGPADARFASCEPGEEEESDYPSVLRFMHRLEQLKRNKRTGWLHHRVPAPESIADHMYRMALLAMLCPNVGLDIGKAVMLALVHDLAEAEVGDLTPLDGVSKEEKLRREGEALQFLVHDLLGSSPAALRIEALWEEYEARESLESVLVKDLDRFELILQAVEYESRYGVEDLQPFFGASADIGHPRVRRWAVELARERADMWGKRGEEWGYVQPEPVEGAKREGGEV
ncbi:hypothetical protein BDZ90DRAFT_234794 [Jaminaea rosea]|uniref:5'-deoxynucleotidase n=1 Tax=Jaminaea rosea TaxID=1569628 RepID=A0A316UKF6_9BASI|nr:hypothetical protein BDZ90DRAFT_234794 [Jaminaea rosea]PWN24851.1 hypothetical protein BDZ90DRAFT_234794 [Jaminaea rosea]